MGPVSGKTVLLRASLKKNPGKGEDTKKHGRLSEARWLSCLVRWKPARVICLTGRRENNPHAKLARVALRPKRAFLYFVYIIKQDF